MKCMRSHSGESRTGCAWFWHCRHVVCSSLQIFNSQFATQMTCSRFLCFLPLTLLPEPSMYRCLLPGFVPAPEEATDLAQMRPEKKATIPVFPPDYISPRCIARSRRAELLQKEESLGLRVWELR